MLCPVKIRGKSTSCRRILEFRRVCSEEKACVRFRRRLPARVAAAPGASTRINLVALYDDAGTTICQRLGIVFLEITGERRTIIKGRYEKIKFANAKVGQETLDLHKESGGKDVCAISDGDQGLSCRRCLVA